VRIHCDVCHYHWSSCACQTTQKHTFERRSFIVETGEVGNFFVNFERRIGLELFESFSEVTCGGSHILVHDNYDSLVCHFKNVVKLIHTLQNWIDYGITNDGITPDSDIVFLFFERFYFIHDVVGKLLEENRIVGLVIDKLETFLRPKCVEFLPVDFWIVLQNFHDVGDADRFFSDHDAKFASMLKFFAINAESFVLEDCPLIFAAEEGVWAHIVVWLFVDGF